LRSLEAPGRKGGWAREDVTLMETKSKEKEDESQDEEGAWIFDDRILDLIGGTTKDGKTSSKDDDATTGKLEGAK
jgi:hypothetical protein